MFQFDRVAAGAALDSIELGPLNRELAQAWLSLWQDGKLPQRGQIDPVQMGKFLPGLSILEIHPDDSVRYRIAGTAFRAGYGFDPSRHDVMALTPPEQRSDRLARFKAFVAGTVGSGLRVVSRSGEPDVPTQDLVLPLGGVSETGARTWIFHTSWRPARSEWPHRTSPVTLGMVKKYIERKLT